MSHKNALSKNCGLSRREFIGGCAGCAAAISLASAFGSSGGCALEGTVSPALGGAVGKTRVRLVMAYPPNNKPIWPNIGYDFDTHNRKFVDNLRKACPDIEFLRSDVMSQADAQAVVQKDNEVDGYLVYLSGCLWGKVPDTFTTLGKPTVLIDHLFAGSGAFLTSYGRARRSGLKVAAVSSSKFEDIAEAAKCIDALVKLRASKVLVVGRKFDPIIQEVFGAEMVAVDFPELGEAYKKCSPAAAAERAKQWTKEAERIIEPSQEDIVKSARMYLAMCDVMNRHKAQAITINCLGGFYSGHISAYPCLGFMQLNNDGFVGACEGDRKSTITMLLMTYLTGQPGFISDPVIDTATNRIIYAHCVAPTKVFGPQKPQNAFHLRSHSEDRKGACNRSLMPLGEITTSLEFDAKKKQVIMHQGVTVENVDKDLACRNKLAAEVKGDVYKLLNEWDQWGWHRVTYFGDYKRAVYNLSALLGFEVLEEA